MKSRGDQGEGVGITEEARILERKLTNVCLAGWVGEIGGAMVGAIVTFKLLNCFVCS